MPEGTGTYGSQKGRPPKKKKKRSELPDVKGTEDLHNPYTKDGKTKKGDRRPDDKPLKD